MSEQPVTTVVRRRIRPGAAAEFTELMREFINVLLQQPGHLGVNVIRQAPDSDEYLIFDRFCTVQARRRFTGTEEYREWMERLGAVSDAPPVIEETEGLSYWFESPRPETAGAGGLPPKWKMSLVTLLGVYPLSMLYPALVVPVTSGWPGWARGLMIAGLIVVSLTWLVMPLLTKIFRPWIHPKES